MFRILLAAIVVATAAVHINGTEDVRWAIPEPPALATELVAAAPGIAYPTGGCYTVQIGWDPAGSPYVNGYGHYPFKVDAVGRFLWLDLIGDWHDGAFNNPDMQSIPIPAGASSVDVCPVTVPDPVPEPEPSNCLDLSIVRNPDGSVFDILVDQQATPLIYWGLIGHYLVTADGPFALDGHAPGEMSHDITGLNSFQACR